MNPPYLQNTQLIHFHCPALDSRMLDKANIVWP